LITFSGLFFQELKGVIVVFRTPHCVYQSKELEANITLQTVLDYFCVSLGELHRVNGTNSSNSENEPQSLLVLKERSALVPSGIYRLVVVSIHFSL
jgi:hypothetical protein